MVQKLHLFSFYLQTKFKNEQKVYWLEEDYMEKPVQNYFHLTPKIGPLCPPPPKLALRIWNLLTHFFFILMDYTHFKTDFSMTKKIYFFFFTSFILQLFFFSL